MRAPQILPHKSQTKSVELTCPIGTASLSFLCLLFPQLPSWSLLQTWILPFWRTVSMQTCFPQVFPRCRIRSHSPACRFSRHFCSIAWAVPVIACLSRVRHRASLWGYVHRPFCEHAPATAICVASGGSEYCLDPLVWGYCCLSRSRPIWCPECSSGASGGGCSSAFLGSQ